MTCFWHASYPKPKLANTLKVVGLATREKGTLSSRTLIEALILDAVLNGLAATHAADAVNIPIPLFVWVCSARLTERR